MTLCIQITIPIAGWVAPFGYPRIKACSRLPMAFRSVPRPSSPPGAKASTECPSRAQIPPHAQEPPTTGAAPSIQDDHHALLSKTTRTPGRMPAILDAQARMPTRVRPTRTAVRTDAHQPLHADKEHDDTSDPARAAGTSAPTRTRDPIRIPSAHQDQPSSGTPGHNPGGGGRDRTDDPLLAKQVLSQLSYAPNGTTHTGWWAREDLNLRPHAYQACALTN